MLSNIMQMLDYNFWANAKILATVAELSEVAYLKIYENDTQSIHDILVHQLSATWIWRSRWEGISPTSMLKPADIPTLSALKERWEVETAQLRAFCSTLSEADLGRPFSYTNTKGASFTFPLWQSLQHLLLHDNQHRSEIALILTRLGHSPGELGLLSFLLP